MTLNDKQLPQPAAGDNPNPGGGAGGGNPVRVPAPSSAATSISTPSGGGGVLQHLEDEEAEEPPEGGKGIKIPPPQTPHTPHQVEPLSRKFTILSKIGEGGYGNVYTVKKVGEFETDSDKVYALKTIRKDRLKRKPKDIEYAQNERYIMASFNHPFIVHLQYAFQSSTELYYIMEYVPGGEIFTRLGRVGTFAEPDVKFYTSEILMALDFLHSHNIIYRDLKPDNILIERDGHIKLADFGLCKVLSRDLRRKDGNLKDGTLSQSVTGSCAFFSSCSDTSPDEADGSDLLCLGDHESASVRRQYLTSAQRSGSVTASSVPAECTTTRSCCGTLVYMAPEVVDKQAYGRSADFWSLGVVVYDMLVGHTPFHVEKRSRHAHRRATVAGLHNHNPVIHSRPKTDRNATRYNILHCNYRLPDDLTEEAKSFIEGLLQLDVNRRLGGFAANADQIKSHPFLTDIVWDDVQAKRMVPPFVPTITCDKDVSHFDTNWTSDVTEVGKVVDASLLEHPVPSPEGQPQEVDELHINNFEYVSPDLDKKPEDEASGHFVFE